MKGRSVITCVLTIVALLAAASVGHAQSNDVRRGGRLVIAIDGEQGTLDPHFQMAGGPHNAIFETLVDWVMDPETGTWGPAPELAVDWEFVDDTLIRFRLREGVYFHDGSKFDAEVAAWNLKRALEHPLSARAADIAFIKDARAIDEYVLEVELVEPTATALLMLSRSGSPRPVGMVSREAVERMGDEEFGRKPVGTGPFMVEEWVPGQHIKLKRWEGYWREGQPYLDEVHWLIIPEETTRILQLLTGDVHIVTSVSGHQVPRISSQDHINFYSVPWRGNHMGIAFSSKNPVFGTNQKLRQALLYAIDREAIARVLGPFGTGVIGKYWIPEGQIGYDEEVPYYTYDPEKAKQLLAEAGYPDGLDLELLIIARDLDIRQAEILKQMWDAIGVRTQIRSVERLTWFELTNAGNFDVTTFRSGYGSDPDERLMTRFHSAGANNHAAHKNLELNAILEAARHEMDPERRHQLYVEAQRMIFDEAMYGVIWVQFSNVAYNNKLRGVEDNIEFWLNFRLHNLWFDE